MYLSKRELLESLKSAVKENYFNHEELYITTARITNIFKEKEEYWWLHDSYPIVKNNTNELLAKYGLEPLGVDELVCGDSVRCESDSISMYPEFKIEILRVK